MRKGYLSAPVIIILALISLAVAFVLFFNANLLKSTKNQPAQSNQTPSDVITESSTDETANWKTYNSRASHYSYVLKYPPDWTYEEKGDLIKFSPPEAINETQSITVLILNYKETPPLPVNYTYSAIRTVQTNYGQIKVKQRKPQAETYIAEITNGDYTAEFRFGQNLERKYDKVFDQILFTFRFE